MALLYIVPTPIGNLRDITLRALEILKEVDVIACEDTRQTLKLLNFYQIKGKRLISYYQPKEEEKIPQIIELIKQGKKVALVSDAGTPAISDPGYKLIKACLEEGIEIEPLPGATALIPALVGSGLPTDKFLFLGFPPKKSQEKFFNKFKNLQLTFILYESPHRILKTLETIKEVFNNPPTVVAKELTKIHQEFIRGNTEEVINYLKNNTEKIKGEFVILFHPEEVPAEAPLNIEEEIQRLKEEGKSAKDIYKYFKEKGIKVSRKEIYKKFAD